MNYLSQLEDQIEKIMKSIKRPESAVNGDIDTRLLLCDLAIATEWNQVEIEKVNFLSKCVDINNKIYLGYYNNGRKAANNELRERSFLELAIALFLKAVFLSHDESTSGINLKRFNTLFKALDIITPDWLTPESELGKVCESNWQTLLHRIPETKNDRKITEFLTRDAEEKHRQLTIIPLTVLFYEGPIARAYLETINALGFKPKKIIELVASRDVVTNKTVGRWLPKRMRMAYAASIQRSKIHYWPKQLLKSKTDLVKGIFSDVQSKLGFSTLQMEQANKLLPLSNYSDCIESLLIEDLNDNVLNQYLSKEIHGAILYTGGGIVPETLLELEHLKFLHVHPGYLPDIRGADCALWSLLLTGHTSASCFYMSSGIDTGDIIQSYWLPAFSFDFDSQDIDLKSLYRSIYGFLDPWVRAFVLREIINNHQQFMGLNSKAQAQEEGITFHFMHPKLQKIVFQSLFE